MSARSVPGRLQADHHRSGVADVVADRTSRLDGSDPLLQLLRRRVGVRVHLDSDFRKAWTAVGVLAKEHRWIQTPFQIQFQAVELDVHLLGDHVSHNVQASCERAKHIFHRVGAGISSPQTGGLIHHKLVLPGRDGRLAMVGGLCTYTKGYQTTHLILSLSAVMSVPRTGTVLIMAHTLHEHNQYAVQ